MTVPKKVVAVFWQDAWTGDNDDIHRPLEMVTVGLLVQADDVGVRTATEIDEYGNLRGLNFVPRCNVVKVITLAGK